MKVSSLDLRGMLDRIGGDRELMDELLDVFLDISPEMMEQMAREAALAYNSQAALHLVHDLKGMAANINAEELRRQAMLYEMSARQEVEGQAREHLRLMQEEYVKVRKELCVYRHRDVI